MALSNRSEFACQNGVREMQSCIMRASVEGQRPDKELSAI